MGVFFFSMEHRVRHECMLCTDYYLYRHDQSRKKRLKLHCKKIEVMVIGWKIESSMRIRQCQRNKEEIVVLY